MSMPWKHLVVVAGLGTLLLAAGPAPSEHDKQLRSEEARRVTSLRLALEQAADADCRGPAMNTAAQSYTLPMICNTLRTSLIPQLRNAQEQACTQGQLPRPWPAEGPAICP